MVVLETGQKSKDSCSLNVPARSPRKRGLRMLSRISLNSALRLSTEVYQTSQTLKTKPSAKGPIWYPFRVLSPWRVDRLALSHLKLMRLCSRVVRAIQADSANVPL